MLKKYLFTLILFSAPLLPMEPWNMDTKELKNELARLHQTHVVLKALEERALIDDYFLQKGIQYNCNLLQRFENIIGLFNTELAQRSDR
jgi:hypothetical protein